MKKEQEDKQFLGGLLIGIIIGALMGYFVYNFTHAIKNTPIKEAEVEHVEKKMSDWSHHPNKDKRDYLENVYRISGKN